MHNLDTVCFTAALAEYRAANPTERRPVDALPLLILSSIAERAEQLKREARAATEGENAVRFVAIGRAVMMGSQCVATARSHTMAKRAANALNNHKPTREGV